MAQSIYRMTAIPKIIRLNTKVYKDGKTLFWGKGQEIGSHGRWKRWSTVVTSLAEYDTWNKVATITHVILPILTGHDVTYIENNSIHGSAMVFITKQAYEIRPENYWKNMPNIYVLDELHINYPFIQDKWDGTTEDAVAIVSIMFSFKRIIDWNGSDIRTALLSSLEISVEHGLSPPAIYSISQYFVHKVSKRAREIRKCLMNNCSNPLIDRIVLLTETDLSKEWASMKGREKIEQTIIGKRMRYCDLIQHTYDNVPLNTIVAFMNADIYLDNTISELYNVNMNDKMFALLRWDTNEYGEEPKLFGPHADSQDTWIVYSDSIKKRTWDYSQFDYQLGRSGCDNRFTTDMFTKRFLISNPAHTIKTMHIHKTEIRDYVKTDIIPSSYYIYISPGPLMDMKQPTTHDNVLNAGVCEPFNIRIRCPTEANGITWCTMLARHNRFVWTHGADVKCAPVLPIYEWKNTCMTCSGIVYTTTSIYVGPKIEDFSKDCTMPLNIDIMSPKQHVPCAFAIPVNKMDIFINIDKFMLYYMSKAYQLMKYCTDGHIWLPKHNTNTVSSFNNGNTKICALSWTPNATAYADRMVGYLPHTSEICKEDIDALRGAWPTWNANSVPRTCVVLVNNGGDTKLSPFIAGVTVDGVKGVLGPEWTVDALDMNASGIDAYSALAGKELCIFFGGEKLDSIWPKLWALPSNGSVLEFQNELKINGEFQHMAAAAGLDSQIITLHKGDDADMRGQALKGLGEWVKNSMKRAVDTVDDIVKETISLSV